MYRLPDTIRFFNDQGMDMMIVWHMEHMNHLPLVGPFLSLQNVYTPPIYYYVTWFFYHVTGSVTGVTYGYFILNIIGIGILIKLAWDIGEWKTAVVMAALLSVSAVMIEHGRQFWQPYPMQLFLSLWLLCVWHAYKSKRVFLLWIGILSFQIAFSVYPSPFLLIPCVGYQLYNWYRKNSTKSTRASSLVQAFGTFITTFSIVFMHQIWFEITHHFPTWNTLILSSVRNTFPNPILLIGRNMYELFASFFSTYYLPDFFKLLPTVVILIFTFVLIKERTIMTKCSPLFTPWCIFTGLILLMLYPYDIQAHRIWAFLPLLFLISALIMTRALYKPSFYSYVAMILFCVYITTNGIVVVKKYFGMAPLDNIKASYVIAHAIQQDMHKRNISEASAGLFYKIPDDPENGSYGIYRIAFWLLESKTFTFPLTPDGNMLQLDYSHPILKPYMYVACDGFSSYESAYQQCVEPTIGSHPYKTLKTITYGKLRVFVLFTEALSQPTPVSRE